MKSVPYIPNSAPFSAEQRAWLNGFLAGLFSQAETEEAGIAAKQEAAISAKPSLLLLFGSQTGTAEQLAKRIGKEAAKQGFDARVMDMAAHASINWTQEQRLLIVTSTWGDGEPPDNALGLWKLLNSESVPPLKHLGFSVLALGDRNYSSFCGAGKGFDERLEALGATRLLARTECDTDYESTAQTWIEAIWRPLKEYQPQSAPDEKTLSVQAAPVLDAQHSAVNPLVYGRKNPFPARLFSNRTLNSNGSSKETRHLEVSLEGSGLAYEVGDALGVLPTNCPGLVHDILQALGCDGEEAVSDASGNEVPLRMALLKSYQITQAPVSLVEWLVNKTSDSLLSGLLKPENKPALDKYLFGREIIDLLTGYPEARLTPAEFIACLKKLQPRLYSISSSLKAHPEQVHITVGIVRYESHGRVRKGVCSTFLADRVDAKTAVPVFVQTSHGFRLPAAADVPVIMVGPGTGIAPFRAFLEERRAVGATGRNWLFFGDQHRTTDFLYREEIEGMHGDGFLSRLDLAFSRDQTDKIYVQNRMLENASELWRWLQEGAHFYVCGDARKMAKDVDAALHEVVRVAGGRGQEEAVEYIQALKQQKRYQRDVY